jgi:hypothetical protein
MKKPIFLVGLILLSMASFAQFSLSGKVVDSESHEPLQGASVFAQNTTRGTITDKDGVFHLYLDKGGYELVVSYTGYASKTITVQGGENREINVELQKADNSMSEVIIRSSNEVPDGWLKYGHFFVEHFIGATPNADSCTLQNPEVLKFLYFKRNDRLKVLASEPLIIANTALGYNLRYELDSFLYFFKTDINSYRGRCLYTEMEGTQEQQVTWKENREKAYYGSRLHFLRAYYDSSLSKEGFTVDVNSKTAWDKFDRLVNPYDTSYYFYDDSTENAELWFPVKASISYTKKAPEKQYLQQYHLPENVPIQISYINLLDGIIIKPNGYFFDQQSWINEGYWSWKNLADQLPYDYEPGK